MRETYSIERLSKLGYKQYKRLMGINRITYFIMEQVLKEAYKSKHIKVSIIKEANQANLQFMIRLSYF